MDEKLTISTVGSLSNHSIISHGPDGVPKFDIPHDKVRVKDMFTTSEII